MGCGGWEGAREEGCMGDTWQKYTTLHKKQRCWGQWLRKSTSSHWGSDLTAQGGRSYYTPAPVVSCLYPVSESIIYFRPGSLSSVSASVVSWLFLVLWSPTLFLLSTTVTQALCHAWLISFLRIDRIENGFHNAYFEGPTLCNIYIYTYLHTLDLSLNQSFMHIIILIFNLHLDTQYTTLF